MGGTQRVLVHAGVPLPEGTWGWETHDLPEAWPYVGPTWLRATERALQDARPWHTVASRYRGELAALPGFIFDTPPAVDFDPRTYFGWTAPTGHEVCCGVERCGDSTAVVDAMGEEAFFPALVLGSPLGYRSEIMFTFWNPALFGELVTAAIASAREDGVKTVLAPWVPDRIGNEHLVEALVAAGGHTTFWGYEDYLPLEASSYDEYIASLPKRRRYRIKQDQRRVADAGIAIERIEGETLRSHIPRIAELTCMNREKNGAAEEPAHIVTILTSLLDAGADLRCYLARKKADVVGCCTTIRKAERLFIKWAGFDYAAIGERSGVYFPLVLDEPMRDSYAEGLRVVECGAGSHKAKALRGCLPRTMTTTVLVVDADDASRVAPLLDAFGERRKTAFALDDERPEPATVGSAGGE